MNIEYKFVPVKTLSKTEAECHHERHLNHHIQSSSIINSYDRSVSKENGDDGENVVHILQATIGAAALTESLFLARQANKQIEPDPYSYEVHTEMYSFKQTCVIPGGQ